MFENLIWLVPTAVAGFGIWRPRAGLIVLAAALPLFGVPPGGPYLGALEVAGLAAVLTAWRGGRFSSSPLAAATIAFLAVSLLSLVPSPYQPPSWRPSALFDLLGALPGVDNSQALYTWRAAADLLLGCGIFFAVCRAFAGRSVRPLALALLAGLTVTLLAGLASFAGLIDLDAFRPIQGFRKGDPRLHSLFFLSGWLAEYLVIASPFALSALLAKRGGRPLVATVLAGATVAALALTHQRGAWAAVAIQLIFFAIFTRSAWRSDLGQGRKVAVTLVVALAVATVALVLAGGHLGSLVERARSIDTGVTTRAPLWGAAVEMLAEKPFFGWGLGSYTPAFDLLHPPGSEGAHPFRGTAHNLYLHVAAERGVLGLFALGLLFWATVTSLRAPRAGEEPLALGLALCLLGMAVYGLVQYMFHLRSLSWLFWILLGCAAVSDARRSAPRLERAARALTLVALILVPVRLVVSEPRALAGNRAFGFHAEEGEPGATFRWTEGRASERVAWTAATLVMSLANGHPLAAERPVVVTVLVDGSPLRTLEVTEEWEELRIELGPPTDDTILLGIRAQPTFRPFSEFRRYPELTPKQHRTGDIRSLGVAIKDVHFE